MAKRKTAETGKAKARRAPAKRKAAGGSGVVVPAAFAGVAPGEQLARLGVTGPVIVPGPKKRKPSKKSERKAAKKGIVRRIASRLGFGGKKKAVTKGKRGGKRRGKSAASAGMVVYESRETSPGNYEAVPMVAPPSSRRAMSRKSNPGKTSKGIHVRVADHVVATHDKHRQTVRLLVVTSSAVAAVRLNKAWTKPSLGGDRGITPLNLEASTITAVGSLVLGGVLKRYKWTKSGDLMMDFGIGQIVGPTVCAVAQGKIPLLAGPPDA